MIGTTVGRYRIDSLLGEGGMGRVYRAFDTTLGRPAAVKVLGENLTGDRLQRFTREARTASSLNHPNVVTIYEIGNLDGSGHFIAMELVEGETLRDALRNGRLELSRALDWVAQIAEGIATAHGAGITHRDLKPENVVIARTGFAKILDFGLAKMHEEPIDEAAANAAADTDTAVMTTIPGVVVGTVGYMSPEQASGREVDHRSDLFAIGCILYECITGRRPFTGVSNIDTLHKIIYSDPPPLEEHAPDTPREVQRVLRKLLAKDPEQRYQSAKDLALDLRELKAELGSQTRQPAPRRRSPLPYLLPLIVVIAIVAAVFSLQRPTAATPPQPPATGATKATTITRVTTTGNVIGSAISPDGEYIAYAHSAEGQQSLWLRQLATGSAIRIVPPSEGGIWGIKFSRDSRSIYYGFKSDADPRGSLYQLSILGGAPRKILGNVESAASFSPDGRQFAVHRIHTPRRGDSAIVIANADGSGERTLITKSRPEHFSPSFWGAPEWSPDGKTIASGLRVDRDSKLVGIDVATGAMRELSKDVWRGIGSAVWLRDGIVICAQSARLTPTQLWMIDASGARRRITNDLYDYRTVTATADGKSLLAVASETRASVWQTTSIRSGAAHKVTSGRYDGHAGVAAANDGTIVYGSIEASRGHLERLEPGAAPRRLAISEWSAGGPSLSPDGRYVVAGLFSDHEAVLGLMNSRDASELRILTPIMPIGPPQRIAFTPDGRWVIYVSAASVGEGLWKVSVDGGKPVRITDFPANNPAVSPDGRFIAFTGDFIGIIPIDGGEPRRVLDTPGGSTATVAWMPDGKALLHNAGPGRTNLWLQPLDGSAPRQITSFDDESILRFDLSPNGKNLAIVRGLSERDAMLIREF